MNLSGLRTRSPPGSGQDSARGNGARVIRQYDLNASIELAAALRVIAGNGILLAIAACVDALAGDTRVDQGRAHGIGAALRKLLVAGLAADAVSKSFNQHPALRVEVEEGDELLDVSRSAGFER